MTKITTLDKVMNHLQDGMTLMAGGFGGVGNPPTIIHQILKAGIKDITLICNDTAFPEVGVGLLITRQRVKKVIASHIGSNPNAGRQMTEGTLEVEFSPQGTLAERVRAGGVGLGGILVDVGLDTIAEEGKEKVWVDGRPYLLEKPLTAEVSIVYAKKADPFGNLVYDTSARNFSPLAAMAGNITIAEAEEIVDVGDLDPEEIVTPGVFVDWVIPSKGVNWQWVWEKT